MKKNIIVVQTKSKLVQYSTCLYSVSFSSHYKVTFSISRIGFLTAIHNDRLGESLLSLKKLFSVLSKIPVEIVYYNFLLLFCLVSSNFFFLADASGFASHIIYLYFPTESCLVFQNEKILIQNK